MPKAKYFPFLQLPLELREEIYQYILLGTQREDALACDIDDQILRTCKQIYAEARPYLYKLNVFEAAIWLPIDRYTPWPIIPANQSFVKRMEHLALYWDMRQFNSFVQIQFESLELRGSILNLKRICMALLRAGTRLRTLKVTMKVPKDIDFGHLPLGQYPFLVPFRPAFSFPAAFKEKHQADILAPLKELRVQKATFAGDFSEATKQSKTYLWDVKTILEGYKPDKPWVFPQKDELSLDLMIPRNLCYYCSPEGHPSWEGTLHRELFFFAEALRPYSMHEKWVKQLDSVSSILSHPKTEKTKGFKRVNIGPVLLILEGVFEDILTFRQSSGQSGLLPGLQAAREYFMCRPGIQEILEAAKSATLNSIILDGKGAHSNAPSGIWQ